MTRQILSLFALLAGAVTLFQLAGAHPIAGTSDDALYSRFPDDNELFTRGELWGSGKYKVDISVYHSEIKPVFIQKFSALGSFISLCGKNPDFAIEKDGTVYPNAVGAAKKTGKCTKNKFSLDLGAVVLAHIPKAPSRSPSPAPSSPRRHRSLEARGELWGSGKYKVDISVYHSQIKPVFIQKFSALGSFISLCGKNPDFAIEKDGTVYPNAVGAAKKTGKCTKNKFSLDLGDVVLAHIPKSRSPSPAPSSPRRHRSLEFLAELLARGFDEEDLTL